MLNVVFCMPWKGLNIHKSFLGQIKFIVINSDWLRVGTVPSFRVGSPDADSYGNPKLNDSASAGRVALITPNPVERISPACHLVLGDNRLN